MRRLISSASHMLLLIAVVFFLQGCGRGGLSVNRFFNDRVARIEYKESVARLKDVHKALEQKYAAIDMARLASDDPLGLVFVNDVTRHRSDRGYPLKNANDARQLMIAAIDDARKGDYDGALKSLKESVRTDSTYFRPHFLMAGLYEKKNDIADMEKEYRYYLRNTAFMRKAAQEKTGLPDLEYMFVKEKLGRRGIDITEPTTAAFDMKYWTIGLACLILGCVLAINLAIRRWKPYIKRG